MCVFLFSFSYVPTEQSFNMVKITLIRFTLRDGVVVRTDILCVERSFVGVVAPEVTENEKIGPKTRADDIKSYEFNRKKIRKVCRLTQSEGIKCLPLL